MFGHNGVFLTEPFYFRSFVNGSENLVRRHCAPFNCLDRFVSDFTLTAFTVILKTYYHARSPDQLDGLHLVSFDG